MLPNMADVLLEWELPYTILSTTTIKDNQLNKSTVVTQTDNNKLVVQSQDKSKLNPNTIDWSLDYLCIHSRTRLNYNDYLLYEGKTYIIKSADNADEGLYGFYEYVGEEYKKAIQ